MQVGYKLKTNVSVKNTEKSLLIFFKFTHKKNKTKIYNTWSKHNIIVWNYPTEESDNKYTLNQNINLHNMY